MRMPKVGEIWNSRHRATGFEKEILDVVDGEITWKYTNLDTSNSNSLPIFIANNEYQRTLEKATFNDLIDQYYAANT